MYTMLILSRDTDGHSTAEIMIATSEAEEKDFIEKSVRDGDGLIVSKFFADYEIDGITHSYYKDCAGFGDNFSLVRIPFEALEDIIGKHYFTSTI